MLTSFVGWARLAVGVGCVATATVIGADRISPTVQSINAAVRAEAYITSAQQRVTTSGDSMGVSAELQDEALALIPRSASYIVASPTDPQVANDKYGISPVTGEILEPWFRYLLLPAIPVTDPAEARYLVCWGCDRSVWDKRTTWLWDSHTGQSLGRLSR